MFRIARPLSVVVIVLAATVLSGCQGHDKVTTAGASRTVDPAASKVLRALGADRVYAMAGDAALHAGFGLLDTTGLHPLTLDPDPALISNVAGNGHEVVLGAAGRAGHAQDGGFLTDAAFRLEGGRRLVTLADPDRGLFAPTVAPDGTVAAIQSDGGFAILRDQQKDWVRDRRLAGTILSPLAWADHGIAVTVAQAGSPHAQVVRLGARHGARLIGSAYCASAVLASPTAGLVVTRPAVKAGVRRGTPGCASAHVLDLAGHDRGTVPAGWTPLCWSADGSALLVSRGTEVGVWRRVGGLGPTAQVGTHVWMAAPIWQ